MGNPPGNGHADGGLWPPVTRDRPCPKCHKADWCRLSPDGAYLCCYRSDDGTGERRTDKAGQDYMFYRLNGATSAEDWDPPRHSHGNFNRLFQATGEECFAEAARFWLERTLAMRQPGRGIGGYLSWSPGEDGALAWRAEPGLLTGAAGVALALLAAATPVEPSWDRMLLASVPARRYQPRT
jgi:hypothetical protein